MSRDRSGEPPSEGPSYEVGYGKPPQHSRFKPGHSGNPRGRAKGSLNTQTLFDMALDQKVTVKEQGTSRKITKREVIFTQWVNKAAASGDPRAVKMLLEFEWRRQAHRAGKSDGGQGGRHDGTQAVEVEADLPDFASMSTADLEVLMEAVRIMDGNRDRPPVPMPPPDPDKAREHPPMPMPPADPGEKEE